MGLLFVGALVILNAQKRKTVFFRGEKQQSEALSGEHEMETKECRSGGVPSRLGTSGLGTPGFAETDWQLLKSTEENLG